MHSVICWICLAYDAEYGILVAFLHGNYVEGRKGVYILRFESNKCQRRISLSAAHTETPGGQLNMLLKRLRGQLHPHNTFVVRGRELCGRNVQNLHSSSESLRQLFDLEPVHFKPGCNVCP